MLALIVLHTVNYPKEIKTVEWMFGLENFLNDNY